MAWRVGMKAVRIAPVKTEQYPSEHLPVVNGIYTIREIVDRGDGLAFLLDEIRNEPREYRDGKFELAFAACRFRPLTERKTSIEIFERIRDGHRVDDPQADELVWERAMADAYQGYQPDYIERRHK